MCVRAGVSASVSRPLAWQLQSRLDDALVSLEKERLTVADLREELEQTVTSAKAAQGKLQAELDALKVRALVCRSDCVTVLFAECAPVFRVSAQVLWCGSV